MIVYKVRHIPSQLFLNKGYPKLTRNGKVYSRRPSTKWFPKGVYGNFHYWQTVPEDWEIVPFELVEIAPLQNN